MGAEHTNFDIQFPKDGEPQVLRGRFSCSSKEKSLEIYTYLSKNKSYLNDRVRIAIFLQKPEHVFCKFADMMAADYERQQKTNAVRGRGRGFQGERGGGFQGERGERQEGGRGGFNNRQGDGGQGGFRDQQH